MIPTWLMIGYLAISGADAVTTHVGLNRGARELILTQSPVTNDVIIGAQTAAVALLTRRLSKDHPRLAKGLLATAFCVRVYAVSNNIRVLLVIK